jgi:hypothetical protein
VANHFLLFPSTNIAMTTTTTTEKGKKLRKQQEKSLRRKSRGFISSEDKDVKNTKTVFDREEEEEEDAAEAEDEDHHDTAANKNSDDDYDDDDDDDDLVEEVTQSVAKEELETLQAQEAKAVAVATVLSAKPRHRKKRAASPPPRKKDEAEDLEGDDLDEPFFTQLEAEKLELKQANKRANLADPANKKQRQGKHTTFDASGDDPERKAKVGDEMYVQVLSDNPQEQHWAESQKKQGRSTIHQVIIPNGQVPPTEKQRRKMRLLEKFKKNNNNNNKKEEQKQPSSSTPGWVRSAKMQRLSFGSRRIGQAAVDFGKRS